MVEITPGEVFAIEGIIGLILLYLGEDALQQVDDKPNENATTKAKSPIEYFVLCHGINSFCRDVARHVSTMMFLTDVNVFLHQFHDLLGVVTQFLAEVGILEVAEELDHVVDDGI